MKISKPSAQQAPASGDGWARFTRAQDPVITDGNRLPPKTASESVPAGSSQKAGSSHEAEKGRGGECLLGESVPLGPLNETQPLTAKTASAGLPTVSLRVSQQRTGRSLEPGPVDLQGPEGRSVLAQIRAHLPRSPTSIAGLASRYEPMRAMRDELGITHVRYQRFMGELPIFGEHVNAQLHPSGRVSFSGTPKVSLRPEVPLHADEGCDEERALRVAKDLAVRQYGAGSGMSVQGARKVLLRDTQSDGSSKLRTAWHISLSDFSTPKEVDALHSGGPVLPNIMVDAGTGEVLSHWNQLHRPHRGQGPLGVTIDRSARVDRPVGQDSVRVELPIERDVRIEKAVLQLGTAERPGIEHDWRGDVVIDVTSPNGESTRLAPFDPNDSRDNVSGDFDLSAAFAGKRSKGTWTVTVSDRFPRLDDGVVRQLNLRLEGPVVRTPKEPPNSGSKDDFAPFVGRVNLDTTRTDRGFVLRNADGSVETLDARAQDPNRIAGRFDLGVPFVDPDDQWGGPGGSIREFAAVETHYGATTFKPFLKEVFGLDSLDGRGMKIQALSNVGTGYNNAFWFREVFHIGHGDGRIFDRLSTVDIVGHELAHGITEKSADLIYERESGGLNESFSDIVGTLFEWWHARQPGARDAGMPPFDWKVGEDTYTPQGSTEDALRSMKDPLSDGRSLDHYSQYNDGVGVHFSSGIQNNAFYLAVEGGQHRLGSEVTGLKEVLGNFDDGMVAAGRIWMRALQFYLTPSSDFQDARAATQRAARDLFPNEPRVAQSIGQAWSAVGVNARTG